MCWKTALWPHLERAWKGWNPFEIRLLFGPLLVSLCFWMVCVAVKRFQDSPVGHVRRRAAVECASIANVWINIHTRRRMWERTTELFKLTHWHRNNLPSIFSCYLPSHIHPPTILLCKIQHLMSICHPASDRHISAGALSLSIPHTSCRCYYRAAFYSGIPSSPTTSSCCYRRRRSRLSTVNSLGKAPSSSSCTVAAVKMVLSHLCCSSLLAEDMTRWENQQRRRRLWKHLLNHPPTHQHRTTTTTSDTHFCSRKMAHLVLKCGIRKLFHDAWPHWEMGQKEAAAGVGRAVRAFRGSSFSFAEKW